MLQGHRAIDEEEEELGRSHVEMVELDLKDEVGVASGNLSPGVKYITINGARRVWQAVCYLVTSWIVSALPFRLFGGTQRYSCSRSLAPPPSRRGLCR